MTRAGQFSRRITLRAITVVTDTYSGHTETLTDVATVRARVEPLEGNEQLQAMQTGMSRPHRFTIHYREGVSGATELVYDGRTFNITSVIDPEARRRDLVIMADEAGA